VLKTLHKLELFEIEEFGENKQDSEQKAKLIKSSLLCPMSL